MKRALLFAIVLSLTLLPLGRLAAWIQADGPAAPAPPAPPAKPVPDRAALEKGFQKTMSGATLVGSFTTNGQQQGDRLKQDKYTLGPVKKLSGDFWLFQTRIQYGERDVTVPLPLEVKWAGDTPVITLTDMNIPGLGTFTARVLVYRGEYAGTWSAGDHGGQMLGRVEKAAAKAQDAAPATEEKPGEAKK